MVVGDVNSTVAAALTATYLRIPIAHVEAGLRSFDREMPEENNRVVVDQLSDLHFITEKEGEANLLAERIAPERIKFVGNVMIDTLYDGLDRAIPAAETFATLGASPAFREAAREGFWLRDAAPAVQRRRSRQAGGADRGAGQGRPSVCRWCSRCIRARAAISRRRGWRRS